MFFAASDFIKNLQACLYGLHDHLNMIAGIWAQAGQSFLDGFCSVSKLAANPLKDIVSSVETTLENVLPHYINLVQVLGAFQSSLRKVY